MTVASPPKSCFCSQLRRWFKDVAFGPLNATLNTLACCQTVQPALLHIDLTLYSALCNKSVQTHFNTHIYYLYLKSVYKNVLLNFALYHVNMNIRRFYFSFLFNYFVYFAIALFLKYSAVATNKFPRLRDTKGSLSLIQSSLAN